MESVDQIPSEEVRNWLELPEDVLSLIFMKLGPVEVLFRAQSVCSLWRKLSQESQLWRSVDMRDLPDVMESGVDFEEVARHAVDRSCGQLIEFSVGHVGTDEVLKYITDRSCPLRCLRLADCIYATDNGMIEVVKKLPLLEELDLSYCQFSKKVIEAIGQFCPRLKSFKLNRRGGWRSYKEYDEEALAIAENMPELRYLQLFRNKLTNEGLRAILDGCPHLEYLDLRQCSGVNLEGGDLKRRCADRIKSLRLPVDPIEENEFDAGTDFDDYLSGFSEIDLMSDDGYDGFDYDGYDPYDGYYGFSDGSELSDDYGSYGSDNPF